MKETANDTSSRTISMKNVPGVSREVLHLHIA